MTTSNGQRTRLLPVLVLTCIISACAAPNATTQTGSASAFSRDKCSALSQWVEPLKWRYPNSNPGGWLEPAARDRMKFLFTDSYFVPVFGSKVDELSDRQIKGIYDALQSTRRKSCKSETYLLSIHPGIWLGRVFDPRFPNTVFSMSSVVAHAEATRGKPNDPVSNATVKLIQKRIAEQGFNVGAIDGEVGPATLEGIKEYKKSKNMRPTNGELSPALMARLDAYNIPAAKPKPVIRTSPPRPATSLSRNSPATTSRTQEVTRYVPQESLAVSLRKLTVGTPIVLTESNTSYFAGVAGTLLNDCPSVGTVSERTKLTSMVFSAQVSNPLLEFFSNDNLGQALTRGTGQAALFNTGFVAGRQVGCGRAAAQVLSALSQSL